MSTGAILDRITPRTRAVLLTHVQGFDGLTQPLLDALADRGIPLIEDVCEAHGATHEGQPLGTFGLASNFSFYFAHHMTTVEGGMVCTDDPELVQVLRMMRSHGMVREATDAELVEGYASRHPDLHPEFIFAWPAYNVRNTELGAVLGLSQLPRLDASNARRRHRFQRFLEYLDPSRFFTDFRVQGSCNYAFNLITREPDEALFGAAVALLGAAGVEIRRGGAGGGNQLRQPYLRQVVPDGAWRDYPIVEHVHDFGLYFGNHDGVEEERLASLCEDLNYL
jgi:CDP-6-deoxy-D-xylo-4-hexulose-3-dehydrase